MCQRCGEDEHFPAECRAAPRAPAPQHRQYTAPSNSGAHAAQYGPPTPAWTAYDSDGHSSPASSYGPPPSQASYRPPPSQASYEPAPPMPRSPIHDGPPPSAPRSESDWSFSPGQSQALQAQYVPPGEFSSPVLSDWRADDGSVGGSYLPSGFVGQPVGIDQVGDVWIGDSGATTHMTPNADPMYDTKPPSPQRSRIILGDGSIKKSTIRGKNRLGVSQQDRLPGHPA